MKGKMSDELCEDTYFISEDFVAVIDGVTSKSDFTYEGKTTGKLAAEIVRSVIEKAEREISFHKLIERVSKEIADFYEQVDFPYKISEKGLQAAAVVYSDCYREIWMIGDCQAAVDGRVYLNSKRSDIILSDMRSLILNIMKEKEGEVKQDFQVKARNIIEPWIVDSTVFANKVVPEYGYSIINGEDIPEALVQRIKLDSKPHEIILTSDGYPKVMKTLGEAEEYLKKVIIEDSACCSLYCSTKGIQDGYTSYDDRTYIRFKI